MVLYDPGVGTLTGRQSFFGWIDKENYTLADKENALTIDEVRDAVKTLLNNGVEEGKRITYYPMLLEVYNVTYLDEDGAVIKTVPILLKSGDSASHTIDETYDPKSTDARFEGWGVAQDSDGKWVLPEESAMTKYNEGDTVTFGAGTGALTDDLVLRAFVPSGYWLIFKENGSGASYTPAAFYRGAATEAPANPTRFGYTFGGWYTGEPATPGGDPTGSPFTFGNVLTATTKVYAKWNPIQNANYTVIIWTENIDGTGYDYKEYVTVQNATVGANTNVVSLNNGTSIRINGSTAAAMNKSYTGFHVKEDPTNVVVKPEGTSVVNVYFDRTEYTFTFEANANGNFSYNRDLDAYEASSPRTAIYTVTKKYGQDISDIWTFTGSNGVSYPETNTNTSWRPIGSSTYTARITSMQTMPAENITFRLLHTTRTTRYFHYYIEVAEGETGTRTFQNTQFKLYQDLPNDFNIVYYNDDFWDLRGFDRLAIAKSGNQVVNLSAGQNISWQDLNKYGGTDNNLYFYYTRKQYVINYMDGQYVDGDGVALDHADQGHLHDSPLIDFDASIASYGKGGANYYAAADKAPADFVFAGWYIDKTCTQPYTFDKMPLDGVTVYAKWVIKQYRVFLYPNATNKNQTGDGQNDPSFESGEQSTSFRIDYGEDLNLTTPRRSEYEFNGWFTDRGLTASINPAAFTPNDTTVTTEYDRTESTERNEYGDVTENINKDDAAHNDRFWITRKLEIYAKWRHKLLGTDGIQVVYEAGDDGEFAGGSKTFTDPLRYQDDADASAQGASTATTEGKEFKKWVLYKWNGTDFEPTETKLLPGVIFKVLATEAQIVDNDTHEVVAIDNLDKNGSYTYTVKFVAEYGSIEAPTPTHINWYQNDQNPSALLHEDTNLQINQAVDIYTLTDGNNIPSRTGYKFLGWAREAEYGLDADNKPVGEKITYYDVTENDLYLKWVDDHYETTEGDIVTQVAADERMPYHAMYAVWEEQYFYVYHSSDGTVEKISLGGVETYNITSKVKGDYIYGGYYKDYAKKGSYDIANPAEYTSAVSGSKAYVGGLGYWKAANAYTENGTAMKPEANMTYFLKEVPAGFLASKLYVIYDAHNDNTVVQNYLISDVDDNNYNEVSLYAKDISTGDRIKLAASYTINDTYNNKTDKITAKTTFGMQAGYVAVWKPDLATADFEFAAGFKTPDGVDVEGAYIRMVTVGDGKYKGNFNSGNGGFAIVDVKNGHIITPGQIVG